MNVINTCYASFMSDSFQLLGRFVGYCFTFLGNLSILSGTFLSWSIFLAWSCKKIIIPAHALRVSSHALSRSRNMRGGTMNRERENLSFQTHH